MYRMFSEYSGNVWAVIFIFLCFSENSFCLSLLVLVVLEADGSFIDANMFLRLLITAAQNPKCSFGYIQKGSFLFVCLFFC